MASKEEMIQELSDAIISCKKDAVLAAVEKAKEIMEPAEIIEKGLSAGMNQVGILFERGKLFLPHVMMAADAMTAGVKILEADMPAGTQTKKLGVIVNGTVEGDVHDIGKSIVSTMLQSAGFEVYDIGRDVPIRNFIEKAKEVNADMIGISALMTTTLQGQRDVIELLKEEGLRDKVGEAKEYVAKKLGVDTMDLSDEHVMRELREELDIGVITSVPGAAKGIAAKMNIEKLLDIKINSCNLFRKQIA